MDHQDIKRRRDIVKKATIDGIECILGIEHQSTVDDQMVLRVGNYDFLTYMNQMKKGSKLNGVGTMTLYTGPDKWKKPRIKEMMSVPKRLDQFINDWKILVVDIKLLNERKISRRKLREIVMLIKAMYEGNYKALIQDIVVLKESLIIAAIFTHTKITEGNEVRMCVEMDRLFNRFKNEGRTKYFKRTVKSKTRKFIKKSRRIIIKYKH